MLGTFPLAAVLKLREQAEKAEERSLISLHGALHKAREQRANLAQQMDQHAKCRAAEINQVLSVAHHHAAALRWRMMQDLLLELNRKIEQLESQANTQRGRFLHAKKDREVLFELYEKHERKRHIAFEKQERKMLDDLFLARLANRR